MDVLPLRLQCQRLNLANSVQNVYTLTMDNNNLSKIPVSELTPDNLNSLKGDRTAPTKPPKRQLKIPKLPLIIGATVLLIGAGIAIYIITRQSNTSDNDAPSSSSNEVEISWQASEDSTDPNAEYLDYQQSIIDSPDTSSDDKFTALLSIANSYIVAGNYNEAESLLGTVSRDSLPVEHQYRLYGVYQFLYEQSGNTTAADQYRTLVEQALNEYWGNQPVVEEPLVEE